MEALSHICVPHFMAFILFCRPPDEIPKQIYENIPLKERKLSANSYNIGPPPSFAPPPPPPPRKT